jgi:hypothetical protein
VGHVGLENESTCAVVVSAASVGCGNSVANPGCGLAPEGSFPTVLRGVQFTMYGWEGTVGTSTPDMWVVYTFDDDQVEVHAINAMDPVEQKDEDDEE